MLEVDVTLLAHGDDQLLHCVHDLRIFLHRCEKGHCLGVFREFAHHLLNIGEVVMDWSEGQSTPVRSGHGTARQSRRKTLNGTTSNRSKHLDE